MAHTPLYEQGLSELRSGRYAEARALFDKSEAEAGTTEDTRKQIAESEVLIAEGKIDVAAQKLASLLDRNPALVEPYLGLARISLFTGQIEDARTHASAAVRVGPQVGLGWTLLGLVDEVESRTESAFSNFARGAELGQDNYLCQYNYGRALTAADKPKSAIPFLLRATELAPDNEEAFIALAVTHHKNGQHDAAIEALEQAADVAPKNPDVWATMADLLFGQKRYNDARTALEEGLETIGDHPALLEKATACALAMDDAPGAVAYIERELKVVPNHEQGWLNLARLSLMVGNPSRSEEAARALIERNPQRWEAWLHLGDLYDAQREEPKAHDAYRKALELAPNEWKVLMNFGAALVQTTDASKHAEGKQLLEKAREIAPSEWRVVYNLALAYVRIGQDERALELAQKIQSQAAADDPMVAEARKLESNLLEKRAKA